ncbi:MAG TPA: Stp1/IreP family PP2C-type Ser/Thr phosphatase [Synergistaceae bacterium]|nr:Stp1/IreP family PP2C-type Ser/Thr phosphatase [Synergistaceae bacterium]
MKIEVSHRTDIGCVRQMNEDALFIDPHCRVFIVADGMGGHNAGDVASRIACDFISRALTLESGGIEPAAPEEFLKRSVEQAHEEILRRSREEPECEGMGTTVEVLWLTEGHALWAHVGDSRIYRIRNGRMQQLTRDHSLINEHIQLGLLNPEDARQSPLRHVILQALGARGKVEVETGSETCHPGDLFLLCSDGLTDAVRDEELARILLSTGDLEVAARNAVEMARQMGGPDNISLILIRLS